MRSQNSRILRRKKRIYMKKDSNRMKQGVRIMGRNMVTGNWANQPDICWIRSDLGINMFMRHISITKGRHRIKIDDQWAEGK